MRSAGAAGTVRSKVNHNLNAEEQPVTHQPAPNWMPPDPSSSTSCHDLDEAQTEMAVILGWAAGSHARLADDQAARLAELEAWAIRRGAVKPPQLSQERRSTTDGLRGRAQRDGSSVTADIQEAS